GRGRRAARSDDRLRDPARSATTARALARGGRRLRGAAPWSEPHTRGAGADARSLPADAAIGPERLERHRAVIGVAEPAPAPARDAQAGAARRGGARGA